MPQIPKDKSLDSTWAFFREGYTFISKRCRRYQTDIFQTRLLLQKTICMRGEGAARIFYDPEHFSRRDAAPQRVQKTLFGQGGVQGMDGAAHRHRKQMFMAIMRPENLDALLDRTGEQWRTSIAQWETMEQVVLFPEVRKLLCRAVCAWAGVPLPEEEVEQRTADLGAMIDGAGAVGPQHWRARRARARAEAWAGDLIQRVRSHQLPVADGRALHTVAWHRDRGGELLDRQVAAVELLNVLRPTVAVARYITFVALALHAHPAALPPLQLGGDEQVAFFVHEVRRYYPFFPFAAARVRRDFEWQGYPFPKGVRVLLDLYGTNHHPGLWERPETFWPERFRTWDQSAYNFIPQGGGDHYENHRCAGEWLTIDLMKMAAVMLSSAVTYEVPEQDLQIPLSRIPAIPNSHFVIRNVRRVPDPIIAR